MKLTAEKWLQLAKTNQPIWEKMLANQNKESLQIAVSPLAAWPLTLLHDIMGLDQMKKSRFS